MSILFTLLKNKYVWIVLILITLFSTLYIQYNKIQRLNSELSTATANISAYDSQLSKAKGDLMGLRLTVEQLDYFNDSIIIELNETRKKLKIKDKELNSMLYIKETLSKVDTIIFRDTIFREPFFSIDTTLYHPYYTLELGLRYPNKITTKPSFVTEKSIFVADKREIIGDPSKVFFIRWFQKRHTVLTIDVVEKNPFADINETRLIQIIK